MENQIDENIIQNSYSNILFVSDLPNGTTLQDLEILFNDYQYIRAFLNNSKINKIWAQAILENEIWANKARHELNGIFLIPLSANNDISKGRPIRICKYELKYYKKKDIDYKKNLLVKNLDIKMSQKEFYNIFLKYGDILSGKIEYEENGKSKGFGYIYYYNEESAENAKNNLNNKEFYGKKLEIVNLIPAKLKNNNKITIFALNLPNDITEKELQSIFGKYGEISYISKTNKGYAFINYKTYESASACLSDLKKNPICFSGQQNLIVKFATSKEERDWMKNSHLNISKNDDDLCKMFFKLINNYEAIRNIYDLDKNIRLFIKIIFVTEYIPTSVEVNENIKCGIVTFHNVKDCELFVTKYLNYCNHRKPMFNCISYNKIKMQLTESFINLENIQNINCDQRGIYSNLNNNNNNINDSINRNIYFNQYSANNSNIMNNYMNQNYNNDNIINNNNYNNGNNIINNYNYFNYNNKNINTQLSNNFMKNYFNNNISNYSQLNNNLFNPKNQYQQYNNNNFQNNNLFNNNNRNNSRFVFNRNLNNNNQENNNVNNSSNLNNHTNNYENKNKNILFDSSKENEKIKKYNNYEKLLKSWDFNSPPKCYYNHSEKENIEEEFIIELSDSIYHIVSEIHPKEAGKITGMIKELGLNKMNLLLSKPDDLHQIIEKAYNMIINNKK